MRRSNGLSYARKLGARGALVMNLLFADYLVAADMLLKLGQALASNSDCLGSQSLLFDYSAAIRIVSQV